MKTNNQTKTLSLGSIFRKVGAVMMCTALLASTNLTLAAEANNLGGGGAYNDFREANPGIANKELRQMFKDHINVGGGAGGGVISLPQPVITNIQSGPNNAINLNADHATKQELREAKQALRLQMQDVQRGFSNQTLQNTGAKLVNAGFGVSLDLNSAIENITLGNNLFKATDSVVINVGGETKTLNAGSKVTAAEYVAAKQVLGAGSQTVNLDANGKAIGGAVDFASMGTKTLKVTDINIGENVTAYGDFGKGGDVKISGDFTNSGSVVAYSSKANAASAAIRADNITNNSGAEITSQLTAGAKDLGGVQTDLGLTLDAKNNLSNFGTISSAGDLTVSAGNSLTNTGTVAAVNNVNVLSPSVTNSGTIASVNSNITLDTPVAAAMNINNVNGTVQALNGSINVRGPNYNAAFDSNVNGGDYLSKNFNINAGQGTVNVNAGNLTGVVSGDGYGTHVTVDNTDTLQLGNLDFIDPTFYNNTGGLGGSINIAGDITVAEDLTIIARRSITNTGTRTITAANGSQGFNINLIAGMALSGIVGGANQTTLGPIPPANANNGQVTVGTAGAVGGNITLNDFTINTRATGAPANSNGGNVLIAARQDGITAGNVAITGASNITTGGTGTGTNGNVVILSGGQIDVVGINTTGGNGGGGNVTVSTANPGGSATYAANGTLAAGGIVGTTNANEDINLNGAFNTGAGSVLLVAGDDISVNATASVVTTSGTISASAADDINVNGAITSSLGGTVGLASAGGGSPTVNLGASVTSTGGIVNIGGEDNILRTAGTVTGSTVNFTSFGGIGTGGSRIFTDAGTLTASAGGSVFISEANAVNIGASSTGGGGNQFNVLSTGAGLMDVTGAISTNNLVLNSNTALTISAAQNIATAITLTANNAGALTTALAGSLQGGTVSLNAAAGGIVTNGTVNGSTVGLTTTGVGTIVTNNTVAATGALTISSNNSLDINGTTSGNSVILGSNGAMTLDGPLSSVGSFTANANGASGTIATTGTINAGTTATMRAFGSTFNVGNLITAGTSASLRAATNLTTSGAGVVNGPSVSLISDSGNIGANTNSRFNTNTVALTATATGGSAFINNTGVLALGASTAGATLDVLTTGNLSNTGVLSGLDVTLRSSGGALTANAPINSGSNLNLRAFGNVTNNAALNSNNVTLQSDNGSLVINNSVTGNTVNLLSFNSINNSTLGGFVTANNTLNLTSTVGSIGSAGDQLIVLANNLSANAAAGSVYIIDASNAANIGLGTSSAAGTFQLTRTNAAAGDIIVAGTLGAANVLLQNVAGDGGVAVNNTISAIGGGDSTSVSLVALGAGAINTNGAAIRTNSLNLQSTSGNIGGGTAINTNAASLTANTTGNVTINDSRATSVTLNTSSGNNFTVNLTTANAGLVVAGQVNGLNSINLSTLGIGNITRSGASSVLTSPTLTLSAGGNIGSNVNALLTDTASLTASAGVGKNIFISENDDVDLGNIVGNAVTISAVGSITNNSASAITGNTVNLSSIVGSIGAAGFGIITNASNLSATALGDVYLFGTNAGTVQIGALSGQVVDLRTSVGNINLLQDVTGTTSVLISSGGPGAGSITQTAGRTILTPTLALFSLGDIGTSGAAIRTSATNISANTIGDAYINGTGSVVLGASQADTFRLVSAGDITLAGALSVNDGTLNTTNNGNIDLQANIVGLSAADAVSVTLNANGTGNISRAVATSIATAALTLTSGSGNIGSNALPILTNASVLKANTTGNVFISDTNLTGITLNQSSGNNFNLAFSSRLNVAEGITGSTILLNANGIDTGVDLNGNITASTKLTINATGAGTILNPGAVLLSTPSLVLTSGTGDIGALVQPILTNASTISASTLGDIFINNIGTGDLNLGPLTGSNLSLGHGGNINVVGLLNFTGDLTLFTGNSGNINVFFAINADDLTLSTAGLGNLNVSANLTGASSVALNVTGGTLTQANGTLISTPQLTLTSISGSMGSSINPITTNAGILTANSSAGGNIFVRDTTTGDLQLVGANGTAGLFSLVATNSAATQIYTPTLGDFVFGGTADIRSLNGSVGNFVSARQLNANNLNNLVVNAAVNVNAFGITNLNFGGGNSSAGQTFVATSGADITSTSSITGTDVAIANLDGSGGSIALAGAVTATTGTAAIVSSADLNNGDFATVNAANLILGSLDGNVGATGPLVLNNTTTPNLLNLAVAADGFVNVAANKSGVLTLRAIGIPFAAPLFSTNNLANGGSYTVTNTGGITVGGAVSATTDVSLTSSAGALSIDSTITGPSSISLSSFASISDGTFGASANLVSPQLNLTSTGASIGSSADRLDLTGGTNVNSPLNLTLNALTDVYVDYAGTSLTLGGGASAAVGTFAVTSTGNLNSSGTVDAAVVDLQAVSVGATMQLDSVITGATSVNLVADGNILNTLGSVNGGALIVTSNNGDIGANADRLNTAVTSVALTALNGSAYVANTGDLSVLASTTLTDLCIDNIGTMTVNGQLNANAFSLDAASLGLLVGDLKINAAIVGTGLASSIVAGADNDITSNATGTIDVESGIFVALNDMNFGANIHSTAAPLSGGFTFTAGGNFTNAVGTLIDGFDITVDATELFLNGNIDTTAFGIGNNVSILSTNTILSGVVAKVATSNLLLDSSDAIGLLADHVVLDNSVETVALIATNNAFVDAPGNINLTGATIGGDLAFTTIGGVGNAGGAVTVSGAVTGANVSITANSGDTNTGTLTVGAAVSATTDVTLLADSTVTTNVGGTVAGTTISITSTNAGLSLGDTVVSSGIANSVSLTSNDSLDATTIAQIAGATVNLTSTAGDIGSSGTPVQVNAQNLALNAFGDAYVSQVNNVNLLASSAGNTLSVVIDPLSIVGGNITVSGALTADIVVLTAESGLVNNGDINVNAVITGNDGAGSGSVTLTADNNITSTLTGDVVADGNIALAAGNNIGSLIALFETQAPSITVAAGQTIATGSAFINHTGDVDITAGSAGTAGTFAFGTDSTVGGNILVSGVLTANNVILTANDGLISDGDITLGALSAVTGTNSVILSADGAIIDNAVITSANVVLNAVDGIGSSSLPVEVTNGVSAMTLVVNGGSADAFVNYLGSNTLTLNASNADDFTLNTSTGSIATGADSVFTGTLSITTNSLTNANDLSAAVINIQSNALSGLTLDGGVGGSLTSTGLITVKATDNNLGLFGQMTYNGTANLFANKTGQAIVLNNGSNSIATVSSFLFTSTVTTLGTGTLTGPWNIVNAGTFANSTGDVTLTGSLNFVGADVAIIASGNIDLTGATLSLSGVNGGDLTMLAGYNFLPATAGQVIDVTNAFGTFTPSAGGSILGGANINTSGTAGNGGSVIAIANNGTINLGTITTTGDATHAGGAVTLIGSNGITVGNIDTTGGSASGPVTLAVASPVVTGLTVQNGSVTAGTITVGAASAGDLSFADITATGANVSLTGGLTAVSDTMIGSGIIAANTLSLTTGSGVANIGNVSLATLNSAGNGVVSVNETNAISLGTITGSGQQLTVTAGGAITNGSNFTVSILNLTGVAAATNAAINLTGNVTASTSGTLTSTGGGDIRGALSTANLTLNSSGNVGVDGTTRFLTDASTLTVDAAGSAFLNVSNNRSTIASLNAGTVTGTLNILKTGDLTTGGVVTAGTAVLNATGNIGSSLASRFLVDTATLTAVAGIGGGVFITDSHPTAVTITGTNTAGTTYAVSTAGDLSNGGTITAASVGLSSGGVLNGLGTISAPILSLTQANELDDDVFAGSTVNATTLSLRSTAGNVGTNSTLDRFVLGNQFTNVSAFSNTGSVFLQSNLNGVTLGGGSAFAGDFDYLGAGTTTVAGNITTTNGDINIVTGINRITVNTGVSLHANGTSAGNGNILLRVSDTAKSAKTSSIITVNGTLETDAAASPDGLITVSVGVVSAPATGKAPKSGVVINTSLGGQIFWGKRASKFNGVSNFTAKGTNIVLNNSIGSRNIIFNSATVDADPPVGPAMNIAINTPKAAAAAPAAIATDAQGAMQTMFGFDTDNAMVTSDLSVLNLNAAPQVQLANNATLATGNVANFTQANRAASGQARANTTFAQVADDDDSYVVGYAAATGETGAAICSDVEIGVAQGKGIEKVQHGDRVVIKKGNVLFVPFKDTTVETPRGNVHIAAKSVALVSISEAGLAVYDLEDQHKGSVSVESNGHNVVLSPGRHVLVTNHHKAEFAQVNAIETVAHRNVLSTMKNGTKAHVTEFSIPTALDTIAPLKAMVKSNHPEAKKIADRMMKTTAIILQIGGGAGQYQHYFKPRMTAMGN